LKEFEARFENVHSDFYNTIQNAVNKYVKLPGADGKDGKIITLRSVFNGPGGYFVKIYPYDMMVETIDGGYYVFMYPTDYIMLVAYNGNWHSISENIY
jgi:hypothetical protein